MDIQTAKKAIRAAAIADDAVIMEGPHGIGKSEIVKQFSAEEDYHLEELFLSHQEVGDIIGIPHTIERDDITITTWSVPIWLQRMHEAAAQGKKCVLFLDELNRAPIDVRQSALQLVLERKIHEHELPTVGVERTLVVAAINPSGDYQVDELDSALLDRFLYLEVEADYKAWLSYASKNTVNSVVVDYIVEHPDRLHWTPEDKGIGSTPRSWTKLAQYMDNVETIPADILFQVMKGKIGTEIASQFYSFYQNYVKIIKIEDIEQVVNDNKDQYSNIEELSEFVSELMIKSEAIQKADMANRLADRYMETDDILVFLTYLYSLEVEICTAFLKSYAEDNAPMYKKLAAVDNEINGKNLFKRIVTAAAKE